MEEHIKIPDSQPEIELPSWVMVLKAPDLKKILEVLGDTVTPQWQIPRCLTEL